MLRIDETVAEEIRVAGAGSYPHECCGALLGREEGAEREVLSVLPLANGRDDSPRNRFVVSADNVRRAEDEARTRGLEVLGWYHSHPDHPARPSEFDREHAWPWYSYMIVSVKRGQAAEMTSWRLADDRSRFWQEAVDARGVLMAEES